VGGVACAKALPIGMIAMAASRNVAMPTDNFSILKQCTVSSSLHRGLFAGGVRYALSTAIQCDRGIRYHS
jgi:hypothetical protein